MEKLKSYKKVCFSIMFLYVILLLPIIGFAELPPEAEWEEEGICARVRIRIEQEVAITRTAFQATLEIDNSPENIPLENLSVTLDVQDSQDQPSNDLFGIKDPELTGIDDVNGTGILSPGTSAKAVWILIPTRDAAPEYPTQYYVGGTISYTEGDTQVNIPLFPASITVIPDPRLELDYFLQRVVYSDDPFTKDIIEPAEPYPLGLILKNTGKGTAYNINITSSQPEIIENEKGLLINFEIIGTQVNTEQVTPSLTVNLGDIGPGQTSVAQWIMTTSLAGKFIEYKAEFEHMDDLGDPRLSIIDRVDIHDIIHAVRINVPDDDQKPDFLADDIDDPDYLPDTLYNSNGSAAPVNVIRDPAINGEISNSNLQTTLTANPPSGWVYIRAEDPGQEKFVLKQVIRSDGREIMVDENAWTTHRTIRLIDHPTVRQHLIHILDYTDGNSYQYTLIYENLLATPKPPVMMFIPDRSFPEGLHFGFLVKASDPNGTAPEISAKPLPGAATFTDQGNGEAKFDWATQTGDAGKYEMTVTASDGELTASQDIIVTIYSPDDTDGDGIPDEWETEQFDTLERDGTGDFDEDGISDLDEYLNVVGPLLDTYELSVAVLPAGAGTTNPSQGLYMYPKGSMVKIQATPAKGYRFDYWAGDVPDSDTSSFTVKMDSSKTVTAHFVVQDTSASEKTGDIDNSGTVNLKDSILGLRILSGITPPGDDYKTADEITLKEVIYALKVSAGFYNEDIPDSGISGTISEDTVWTDFVAVTGDVTVADGVMLTVDPGTYVEFQGHYKLDVQGTLTAKGTPEQRITFTAKNKTEGWRGIRFDNDTGVMHDNPPSELVCCNIHYGNATPGGRAGKIHDEKGGAVLLQNFSGLLISECLISNNRAAYTGGGIRCYLSDPVIRNSIIANNTADIGGGVYCYLSEPVFINNTVVNNHADIGGGLCFSGTSEPVLRNTAIWGNTSDSGGNQIALLQDESDPYFDYCNVQGGTAAFGGDGAGANYDASRYQNSISANPLFAEPSSGAGADFDALSSDWSLQAGSPCINAGDPDTPADEAGTEDFAGSPRISGEAPDIGAFEYQE